MTNRRVTQETGVLNATPASGDQGGLLNIATRSSGSVGFSYTDETAALGSRSVKIVAAAAADTALLEVLAAAPSDVIFTSVFFRLAGSPTTAEVRAVSVRVNATSGSTDGVRVAVKTDRGVTLYNQGGAGIGAAGTLPAATWLRCDVWGRMSTGAMELRIYEGVETTGPLVTYSATSGWVWGAASGATAITGVRAGKINTGGVLTMFVDDMIVDDTATGLLAPPSDFTPPVLDVTVLTATSARSDWTASPGATAYQLYQAPDVAGSPGTYTKVYDGALRTFTHTGLTAGAKYHRYAEGSK